MFYEMKIITNGALDVIFGILACLTSIVLFIQQVIIWTKDTRGILPYPYIVAAYNCIYWLIYATPVTGKTIQFHDYCICFSCAVGSVMANMYIITFWRCCKEINRYMLCTIGMTINLATLLFIPWKALMLENRNSIVGPLIVISGTMFYASPVFTIFEALRMKRVESLPFGFLKVSCLNGFVWMIYTCLPSNFDLFVAITNGVGTIFSIAQLGLAYEIQTVIAAIGTAQQTKDCKAQDGENNKFMNDASTPLLDVSQPETCVFGNSSGSNVDLEVHLSSHLMAKGQVVDEAEATKQQENGMGDGGLDIGKKCNSLSLPIPSSSLCSGVIDGNLEAQFNEVGLPAVMSYAVVSYFGGLQAALHLEKNMSKMNKDICDLRMQNNKLKEILETVVKNGGNGDGACKIVECSSSG